MERIHLTFTTDASGDVRIDKALSEPFVGSVEYCRAQGWRSMDSAPRDGTPFLAAVEWDGFPIALRWYAYDAETSAELGECGYFHYADESLCDLDPDAVQSFNEGFVWQPLPLPPSPKEAE